MDPLSQVEHRMLALAEELDIDGHELFTDSLEQYPSISSQKPRQRQRTAGRRLKPLHVKTPVSKHEITSGLRGRKDSVNSQGIIPPGGSILGPSLRRRGLDLSVRFGGIPQRELETARKATEAVENIKRIRKQLEDRYYPEVQEAFLPRFDFVPHIRDPSESSDTNLVPSICTPSDVSQASKASARSSLGSVLGWSSRTDGSSEEQRPFSREGMEKWGDSFDYEEQEPLFIRGRSKSWYLRRMKIVRRRRIQSAGMRFFPGFRTEQDSLEHFDEILKNHSVFRIQAMLKGAKVRKEFNAFRNSVMVFQNLVKSQHRKKVLAVQGTQRAFRKLRAIKARRRIARFFRRRTYRQHGAARSIQRRWRGHVSRKLCALRRSSKLLIHLLMVEGSVYYGFLSALFQFITTFYTARRIASVKIQARVRGFCTRRRLLFKYAVAIQRTGRGFLARKAYQQQLHDAILLERQRERKERTALLAEVMANGTELQNYLATTSGLLEIQNESKLLENDVRGILTRGPDLPETSHLPEFPGKESYRIHPSEEEMGQGSQEGTKEAEANNGAVCYKEPVWVSLFLLLDQEGLGFLDLEQLAFYLEVLRIPLKSFHLMEVYERDVAERAKQRRMKVLQQVRRWQIQWKEEQMAKAKHRKKLLRELQKARKEREIAKARDKNGQVSGIKRILQQRFSKRSRLQAIREDKVPFTPYDATMYDKQRSRRERKAMAQEDIEKHRVLPPLRRLNHRQSTSGRRTGRASSHRSRRSKPSTDRSLVSSHHSSSRRDSELQEGSSGKLGKGSEIVEVEGPDSASDSDSDYDSDDFEEKSEFELMYERELKVDRQWDGRDDSGRSFISLSGIVNGMAQLGMDIHELRFVFKKKHLKFKQLGSYFNVIAQKRLLWRKQADFVIAKRKEFRNLNPPNFACPRCVRTFPLYSHYALHLRLGCRLSEVRSWYSGPTLQLKKTESKLGVQEDLTSFIAKHIQTD